MARAAPPIILVALIAACLALAALLVAPSARARTAAGAHAAGVAASAAKARSKAGARKQRSAAKQRSKAGARKRAAARAKAKRRPAPRCSPAGIRRLRGTSRVERRIRCLINGQRSRTGIRPLRYDRCLDRAAERHARDMVRRHYFAHTSRGGHDLGQRVRAAGYVRRARGWRLGENLAWGAGRDATARATVRGWMNSTPHRTNILTAGFRDVGVAVVRGAPVRGRSRGATFVVEFGARQPGRCSR